MNECIELLKGIKKDLDIIASNKEAEKQSDKWHVATGNVEKIKYLGNHKAIIVKD